MNNRILAVIAIVILVSGVVGVAHATNFNLSRSNSYKTKTPTIHPPTTKLDTTPSTTFKKDNQSPNNPNYKAQANHVSNPQLVPNNGVVAQQATQAHNTQNSQQAHNAQQATQAQQAHESQPSHKTTSIIPTLPNNHKYSIPKLPGH